MERSRATRFGRAGLLLAMLLMAGCAAVPDLGSKPVPAAASDYASANSLSGPQSDRPVEGWWRSYKHAQLDELIGYGLFGSPDLAAATARLRSARGLVQQAGSALLPRIDANLSLDEHKASRNADGSNSARLAAGSAPPDTFGRNIHG